MAVFFKKEDILPYREQILTRIRGKHFRTVPGHNGRIFTISTAYPGYRPEYLYDTI